MRSLNKISIKKPINSESDVTFNVEPLQVVDFDENTAFPVVADPSWWQITKCVATVGAVIVGTIFSVAKIAKTKK